MPEVRLLTAPVEINTQCTRQAVLLARRNFDTGQLLWAVSIEDWTYSREVGRFTLFSTKRTHESVLDARHFDQALHWFVDTARTIGAEINVDALYGDPAGVIERVLDYGQPEFARPLGVADHQVLGQALMCLDRPRAYATMVGGKTPGRFAF